MAWPDADELKRVLDVTGDEHDTTLDRVLAAAISRVKDEVGGTGDDNEWDEYEDEPDDNHGQAALRMAELMATRPDADPALLGKDPTYRALLFGRRKQFGIG
jgi:hypothetical protein